ncbi:hypothetical protein, partial [Amycolatopsis speibonae]
MVVVAAQLGLNRPDELTSSDHGDSGEASSGFVSVAEWNAVRGVVSPTRHQGERLVSGENRASGGGQVVENRFDVRRDEVRRVTEVSVPVDLVSLSGAVDAGVRRGWAEQVQSALDGRVNGRYRLPNGDQLHVVVDAGTPDGPPRPGWEADPFRRVPVHVVDRAERTGQLVWRLGDTGAAVGKVLRFAGVSDGPRPGSGRNQGLSGADVDAIADTIRLTPERAAAVVDDAGPDRPAVVNAGPGGETRASSDVASGPGRFVAAGTTWTRAGDGWYVADGEGVLDRGPGAGRVDLPEGTKAGFDFSGELRFVVLPDGVSYDRDLRGEWSPPRTKRGEVKALKLDNAKKLYTSDGSLLVELEPENEQISDSHGDKKVVAYRQVTDAEGQRLPQPVVFVPDDAGGWRTHEADTPTYEAWLAGANKAYDAAKTYYDIIARSHPDLPEDQRLTNLSGERLARLYQTGSRDDVIAAVFELIRRSEGISLRWTQLEAVHVFRKKHNVNMYAGEGKSWLFFAFAALAAVDRDWGLDAVLMETTRDVLADKDFGTYNDLLGSFGVDVHRVNSDEPSPAPRDGRPQIHVGTMEQTGFHVLKQGFLPGQERPGDPRALGMGIDEMDEAAWYSQAKWILSTMMGKGASLEIKKKVEWGVKLVDDSLASGWLEEADFGRVPDREGEPSSLTSSGQEKLELLLGRPMTVDEVRLVNMGAVSKWDYEVEQDFEVQNGKLVIINPTTHDTMLDPKTSSESRWNNGLAQALEYRLGLEIREDSSGSKELDVAELLAKPEIKVKVGASGTANGHGEHFASKGLSSVIVDTPTYYEPRLKRFADVVLPTKEAKLDRMADDINAMQSPDARTRQQQADTPQQAGAQPNEQIGTQQPQWVVATKNKEVRELSERLTELGAPHLAINAKWFLNQGVHADEAFKAVTKRAGELGMVVVINLKGGRGVDVIVTKAAKAAGDLFVRVTSRSVFDDINTQVERRAGRSGGGGGIQFYGSLDEPKFARKRHHPDVELAITKYENAEVAGDLEARAEAVDELSRIVPDTQPNPGHPTVDISTAQPNAPPHATADPGTRDLFLESETRPPDGQADRPTALARPGALYHPPGQNEDSLDLPHAGNTTPDLSYVDSLANALDVAVQDFAGQLALWEAKHPDVVLPDRAVERLWDEFRAPREADFEQRFGPSRTEVLSGGDVRERWRSWLDGLSSARETLAGSFAEAARGFDAGSGQGPAPDIRSFADRASNIVSRYHRVPVRGENPAPDQADAVEVHDQVRAIVAGYLADGLSEQGAHALAEELAPKLSTSLASLQQAAVPPGFDEDTDDDDTDTGPRTTEPTPDTDTGGTTVPETAPVTKTRALPGTAGAIPSYFRRNKAMGIATQLSPTEEIGQVIASARSFAPKEPTATEVADLENALGSDIGSFFGEGRVFVLGGRPVRIRVDDLHWPKQETAGRPGTTKPMTREGSVSTGTRTGTATNPKTTWIFFTPMVPGLFATGFFSLPTAVSTQRDHGHDLGATRQVSVSLPERSGDGESGYQGSRSTRVSMTVVVEPEDRRSDDPQLSIRHPGNSSLFEAVTAEFGVPEGLSEEGRPLPLPDVLPPSATEAVTVQRGMTRKIFDQVLARLGKLDEDSLEVLREFLDTSTITAKLSDMAVTPQADAETGWVTSHALVRGGNPAKRLVSSRSRKVQMRAVARKVAYLETIEDAEFREHETESSSQTASSTAGRDVSASFAGGPGFDYGMVTAGGGPAVGGAYNKSKTTTHGQESGLAVVRSYKDSVVRYRTVYDVQVRVPGRAPLTFAGAAEGTQWAQLDDARQAGLLPAEIAGGSEKGLSGPGTGTAGAPLKLSDASDRLKTILHDSAKTIPGHNRWAWRDAGLASPFSDPKLKKGLTGKLERQLGRWDTIDMAVSADNLARRLPDLLFDQSPQFLELAPEPGRAHDYHTGFQIDARLLTPLGEPLGPAKGGTGIVTLSAAERGGDTATSGWSLTAGVRARIYAALAANTGLLTSTHTMTFTRTKTTGRARDTELATGGTAGSELDESGAVVPEPKYRYAAKVELKVSGSYWSRYNDLVRGLSVGKPGRHVPEDHRLPIIDSRAAADGRAPRTIVADVVLELTETERNALRSVSVTGGTRLPSKPLNMADYLRTGTSRALDGVQVLSVSGLDHVRKQIRKELKRASGDPIWKYRDGENSALIDQAISAETMRSDPRVFNRPARIDGLRWKRRSATRIGAVGVSYRLRDPEVLETVWQQPKQDAGTSTSTSSDNERGWGFTNEIEPAISALSEGAAHSPGTVIRGVGLARTELNLWRTSISKRLSRKTQVSTNTSQTLEPRRVHVVEATLETTVSVETGRRGLLDRWHFRRTRPAKTAAHRSELPRSVRVLLTDEQLHEVRIQQAAEDARRGLVSPAPAVPQSVGHIGEVPEGQSLGGSNWAAGISEPVDLTGQLYEADEPDETGNTTGLYARLESALSKEKTDQLLNSAASDTGHDNHRAIVRFLSNFQASMADLANGGASAGLRLENKLSGETYHLVVDVKPKSEPKPVGVVHGELTKISVASVWAEAGRTAKRNFVELVTDSAPAGMFQSESDVQEAQRDPGEHGAPAARLGYGVGHVLEWLSQFRSRSTSRTADSMRSETVSGALAERSVELDFDIRFERHGERIADISTERTVRTRSAVEDQGTGDDLPHEGMVTRRPASEATKDALDNWRRPAGAAKLPADPADYRITHFDGQVEALRDAAQAVLEAATGNKLGSRTLALLRDQLTPSQLNALAPSHFGAGSASTLPAEAVLPETDDATGTELIIPAELGVKLTLHAMLDGPGALENASGRITVNGQTDSTRTEEFSGGTETVQAAVTLPVMGAGVPQAPGHTTYEDGRQTFGALSALFFGFETHGAVGEGHEHEGAKLSGDKAPAKPGSPAAADPITSTWSYPTRFRLVAEPVSTGPFARRSTQVADVDYDKGYHVRRKDQNHRLPVALKNSVLELAARDREWTAARGKARAVAAKNPTGAVSETAFERRAAAKFWKAKHEYDTALGAAQADPALHGGRRVVRMELPAGTQAVPIEHWKPLSQLARDLLAARDEDGAPQVRYRVIGDPETASGDFTAVVMPKLDSFVNLAQLSVPPAQRLGRNELGLATEPEIVPGTGDTVVEIWVDENAGRLPAADAADEAGLPPIWEEAVSTLDSLSDVDSLYALPEEVDGRDAPITAPALAGGQRLLRVELSSGNRDGGAELQNQAHDVAQFLLDNPGAEVLARVFGDEAETIYQTLVVPALDEAAYQAQMSLSGATLRHGETGVAALGLTNAPEVVPGAGNPVIEIWARTSEEGAAAGISHPDTRQSGRLDTIPEEDESEPGHGRGNGAPSTPGTNKAGPSFREALPEYARDGKALGLVVVTEVPGRDKVGERITEMLAPFGDEKPEGVNAIVGRLNRARFETFLGPNPAETPNGRMQGGRRFPVRVGKKWFEAHVVAVMDLDAATPGGGKREPFRAVREVRDQHVLGHTLSRAGNSFYRLGLSTISLLSAGIPFIAGFGARLARPVGVRTFDESANAQAIWLPKSEALSAKVPVTYYITLTGDDGGVTGGTTTGEVNLLLPDSVSKITEPDGVSRGEPSLGWEKRIGYLAVEAVHLDESALFDKVQRNVHPSVTGLAAPGRAALREFVSSANVRSLSRKMWPGEAVPSADLVSPHGAYREGARMEFRPHDVEFIGVVSADAESRTQDTVTTEESVTFTSKAGPDAFVGVGGGGGVPGVAMGYGGATGNVGASISDSAVAGRSATTGTSMYVHGDVGRFRVTGELAVQTSHGEWVKEPVTKYVRLDLHEAAAEDLPVPPGYEKRFIDVGPRFEPPYLAAAAAGGHVRAGVTRGAADVLPRIEEALRRASGLRDLLPEWSSPEAKTTRGSGDVMEERLSNQRKLASKYSVTSLMNRLDSLLGPGVFTQLKRRGFFYNEFISVRVKGTLDGGRHLGQVDGRAVVGVQTAGTAVAGGASVNRGWGGGPEARGRFGFSDGTDIGGVVNFAAMPVSFADGRSWKNTGAARSALTIEQVGTEHSQVFSHGITFDIEIVSHRRPRGWVRRLTPGSPFRSTPDVRAIAGSQPGAEVPLSPVTGQTELWVSDSVVHKTDPSRFAPGRSSVVHLGSGQTPAIDELSSTATAMPEFLYVEAFAHAGELGELAVDLANRATNDDEVLVLPGSDGHQLVHQWFAPETLWSLLKSSSTPVFRRNGLSYGRRTSKRIGALGMRMELTEPLVVKVADTGRDKVTFSGGTKATSESYRVKALGAGANVNFFAPDATSASEVGGRFALGASAKFWGRRRGGSREQTVMVDRKDKASAHSRRVLVRYDVRTRMVAESRQKVIKDGVVSTAGADKFMPGSLFLWMSERQARAQGLLPPAEPRETAPKLGTPELALGSSGSLGAYVVEGSLDLTHLLPALRADLSGKDRDLIPKSVLDDAMGNAERLGALIDGTTATSLLDNALDGGLPLRIHKPGVLWSDDYNVLLEATVETVEFDDYENDGALIENVISNSAPTKALEERSKSRSGWVRPGWRSLFSTGAPNGGGAMGGSAGVGGTHERADRRVAGSGLATTRATVGSGPSARYRVRLRWDLKVEKGGREIASSGLTGRITIRANADDQKVGGGKGQVHESSTIPLGRHTDASVKEWQSEGLKLPADARVEGFRGAADIREGVVQAIKGAGAKAGLTNSETGAMNTLALSVTNAVIRANLAKTSAASLPLPELYSMSLAGGQEAKVKIYSRLSGARITGLSDNFRFDQSAQSLESFTSDTGRSGAAGGQLIGGDGGIHDGDGNLHIPGGAQTHAAAAIHQVAGATTGLRSVTLQDTGRSGLTKVDTEHLIVADVDGVTSAVVVQLPSSALPRVINADLAKMLGAPLPDKAAQAQDSVSRAAALWRAKETILHRKQGEADQKWFDLQEVTHRLREAAGVPGDTQLDPQVAAQRARVTASVTALQAVEAGPRDEARERSRNLAARLAAEEEKLDAAAEEHAQARAGLTEAVRAADVARAAWLSAKGVLESELAELNAGLREQGGSLAAGLAGKDASAGRESEPVDGEPRKSLPDWVRRKSDWARALLETAQVTGKVVGGFAGEARQVLSEYFPELAAHGPEAVELHGILHTIMTAERVNHHLSGESLADAAGMLRGLAQELADEVETPGVTAAEAVGARLDDSAEDSAAGKGTRVNGIGDSDSDAVGRTFFSDSESDAVTLAEPVAGRARATWSGHLDGSGRLNGSQRRDVELMVEGFVDAAVAARPGHEPSLQGGVVVPPGSAAPGRVWSLVKSVVRNRLSAYPPGAAGISAKELLSRMKVSAIAPSGDRSVGTVQLRVSGQRPAVGLFGPEVFTDPANPLPRRAEELARARAGLAGLEQSDPVFARAREIVNRRHQAPRAFVEALSWVDRAHRSRYRAAVDLVAWELYRYDGDERGPVSADALSHALVGEVMWPRGEGVLGGVPSVHDDVMVAPVGVIIGGVGSELRDAAALLLKEAGVHGVVLLDHGVRDLEVIERAVRGSGWGGEPVRLFACETGDGALDRLAVGLQERLGVAVGYP